MRYKLRRIKQSSTYLQLNNDKRITSNVSEKQRSSLEKHNIL